MAKLKCLNCSQPIAELENDILSFNVMNVVSKIEINFKDSTKDVKCRCGCWNTFDVDNNQKNNHQRRSQEALYQGTNFNNALRFGKKGK